MVSKLPGKEGQENPGDRVQGDYYYSKLLAYVWRRGVEVGVATVGLRGPRRGRVLEVETLGQYGSSVLFIFGADVPQCS